MTQSDLRARFNPDGSPLRRHQLHLLEMLRRIDEYCRRHHITYILSSGTLLGAVRHSGFVPWDDDLDIEMTAGEFCKFRKALKKDPIPGLAWQDWKTERLYVQPFAKLRDTESTSMHEPGSLDMEYENSGPFIDIFPLYPSNSRKLAHAGLRLQNLLLYRTLRSGPRARRALLPITKIIVHGALFPLLRLFSRPGAGKNYRHTPGTSFLAPRHIDDLTDTKEINFEDYKFPGPANYDRYLTKIYGDYMKLPDFGNLPKHFV